MTDKKPAKRGSTLRTIRSGMSRANEKYMVGGRLNPKYKPITLRLPPEKRREP